MTFKGALLLSFKKIFGGASLPRVLVPLHYWNLKNNIIIKIFNCTRSVISLSQNSRMAVSRHKLIDYSPPAIVPPCNSSTRLCCCCDYRCTARQTPDERVGSRHTGGREGGRDLRQVESVHRSLVTTRDYLQRGPTEQLLQSLWLNRST